MKPFCVAATFMLAMATLGASHTAGESNTTAVTNEQEIRQLLHAWDEAYRQRDVQGLSRILAEGFTLTDASGAVLNKSQYLMSIVKSPDVSRVKSFESEDVTIQIDGDTAVVSGRSPVKGRPGGKAQAFGGNYRFTDRWVQQEGVWKPVASRTSTIK